MPIIKEVTIEGFGIQSKELTALKECKCWNLIELGIMMGR